MIQKIRDELVQSHNEVYVYREQSSIMSLQELYHLKNGVNKVLFESNSHDKNFNQAER
jgi:hypothetical protein